MRTAEHNLKVTEQALAGTSFVNWVMLLWENRFRISLRYLPRAIFITLVAVSSIPLEIYEKMRFGARIHKTRIDKPPIFLVGHWRSGTTFLHMLLTRNRNFAFVSNMQAFMPLVFIGSGHLFRPSMKRFLPEKRRMDNFDLDLDGPSEEEFAIANLSPYSLHHGISFPKKKRYYARYCSFDGVQPKTVKRWKQIYLRFLKKIVFYTKGKRLVLKNPLNTFRIKLLLEMFPSAKFIHIYRNPFEVFSSTLRMYERMFPYFYLQVPNEGHEDFIIELYEKMFSKFVKERNLIPAGNLVEVKYEELVADPISTIKVIYQKLGLPGFRATKTAMTAYVDSQKSYQKNSHKLDEKTKRKIADRWRIPLERLGYF